MCLIAKVHGNDKIQILKNRRKKVKAIINNGCLHATWTQKTIAMLQVLVQIKFENFGDMIRKGKMVKKV